MGSEQSASTSNRSASPLPPLTAPAEQQSAIVDGIVTWDEHESALHKVATCLADAGVNVEVRPAVGKRPTDIGFSAKTIEQGEQARAKLEDCKSTYLDVVEQIWRTQMQPSVEQEQIMSSWLFRCIDDQGITLTTKTVRAVVEMLNKGSQEEHHAAVACFQQEKETFGITS
jgi:hypothetical protein